MMNSLGARIGVGAVTLVLGAFAAAQAQKDRQNTKSEEWVATTPPSLSQPPAPLAAVSGELAAAEISPAPLGEETAPNTDDVFGRGSAIQLVQHTEESVGDAPTLALPAMGGGDTIDAPVVSAAEAPGWALPTAGEAEAVGAAEAAEASPAATLALPNMPTENTTVVDDAPAFNPLAVPPLPGSDDVDGPSAAPAIGAAAIGFAAGQAVGDTNEPSAAISPEYPNALRAEMGSDNPMRGATTETEAPSGFPSAPQFKGGNVELSAQPSAPNIDTGLIPGAAAAVAGGVAAATIDTADGLTDSVDYPAVAQPSPNAPVRFGGEAGSVSAMSELQPDAYQPANQTYPAAQPEARIASLPQPGQSLQLQADPQTLPHTAQPNAIQPNTMQVGGMQPYAADASATLSQPETTDSAPGDRRLEGVQTPSIVIQKRAPNEVKVGKPASFVIHVKNVGAVEALDVRVHDRVPAGMRMIDASPAPVMQGDMLLWQLGAMAAGDERTVTMQLVPEQEGELGSVARVSFEAAASVRTISTRPELKIVQKSLDKVLIGQQLEIELEVSNPGTGEATGVILQEDVPEGLEHPKGRKLDNRIGTLAPGETRRQVLRLRAVKPGMIQNHIRLVGDDGLAAEHSINVEVVAPQLQVVLAGPGKRFLERQATYYLEIANVGTAPADNVEIAVQLDRGFTFVSTENEGVYDASRHTVRWFVSQLPPGESGRVPLTLLPVEQGQRAINIEARADLDVVAKNERAITVDAFAELNFTITNAGGPIEVGSETMYEIKVQNSGTRADSNVQVQLQLPPSLQLIEADGDAQTDGRGLVVFRTQPQLEPGKDVTYRVRVQGVAAGTHLVKAVVASDQSQVPVTKEESTQVYTDQ